MEDEMWKLYKVRYTLGKPNAARSTVVSAETEMEALSIARNYVLGIKRLEHTSVAEVTLVELVNA
jgi:hypothetical protein